MCSRPLLPLAEGSPARPVLPPSTSLSVSQGYPVTCAPESFQKFQNTANKHRRVMKSDLSVLLVLASPQGPNGSSDTHPSSVMRWRGSYQTPASGGPGLHAPLDSLSPSRPLEAHLSWDHAVSIQAWCLSRMETLDCNPLFHIHNIDYYYMVII